MLPFLFVLLLVGCTPKTPDIPTYPTFKEVRNVFMNRCMSCHSDNFRPYGESTNWIDEAIVRQRKDKIYERVIVKKTMPQGNILTTYEFEVIKRYLENLK